MFFFYVDVCFVYSSFVCIFAIAYIFKSKVHCGSALRFGRALSDYPIYYCAPLVCIPEVIGLLAVWQHNKPKPKPSVCVIDVIGALAVWIQ